MARPDLSDPQQLAAYKRELRQLYRPWRWLGLAIVIAAVGVMLWGGEGFDRTSIVMLVIGWAILAGVVVGRTRYHKRRMGDA